MMNIFQKLTELILQELRNGVHPWRKPWGKKTTNNRRIVVSLPQNAETKKPYNGINIILLWFRAWTREYTSPYWATEKTWKRLGASVKTLEMPTEVCFKYNKTYNVFNLEQVSGCEELHDVVNEQGIWDFQPAEDLISKSGAAILHKGKKASYCRLTDMIEVPSKERFPTAIGYYTTVLHELTHWTGHENRLNRPFGFFGSRVYAFEELIAELASCFLASMLKVPQALEEMPNHASYIADWQEILEMDDSAIYRASVSASKAAVYLFKAKYQKPNKEYVNSAAQYR